MYLPQLPSGHHYRILIVEDDPAILRLAALPLKSSGFDIFAARDGLEAWSQIPQVNPHLILTDIKMPNLSGTELVERVRRASAIPILMMTAHDSEEAQFQALKLGADDYISKPFTPHLLTARIAANLRRVYRYNGPGSSGAASEPSASVRPSRRGIPSPISEGLPGGFVRCDSCGYIGPEWKFETRNSHGDLAEECPHCHSKSVTFALG